MVFFCLVCNRNRTIPKLIILLTVEKFLVSYRSKFATITVLFIYILHHLLNVVICSVAKYQLAENVHLFTYEKDFTWAVFEFLMSTYQYYHGAVGFSNLYLSS
jgi:hypothetical protein